MKAPMFAWVFGGCALLVVLVTAAVQSENHARAKRLADIQRRCEMIEAANVQAQASVRAHVWGEPNRPLAQRGKRGPAASGAGATDHKAVE
ncbi:MAG: hypothetical protein L6Q99_19900 [Planctomycetes bacterium]|nr:hypothetical protein [Planctomycetota bacterium]